MYKKSVMFLLVASVFSVHARWRVSSIKNNSDLSLEGVEAFYGNDQLHVPLTENLQKNCTKSVISIPSSYGEVGKTSNGFNKLKFSNGVVLDFDSVSMPKLNRGRVRAQVISADLGKHSSLTGYAARAEMSDGDDVLDSDYQNHDAEGAQYSIVISGQNGNYSLSLE